jgi:hypothetical protein
MHHLDLTDAEFATLIAALQTSIVSGFAAGTTRPLAAAHGEMPSRQAAVALRERCTACHPVRDADGATYVLGRLVEVIDEAGGLRAVRGNAILAPVHSPAWIDLGTTYLDACTVLGRSPRMDESATHAALTPSPRPAGASA